MDSYRSWILLALVLFVAQSDLRQYRISNRSVVITLVAGLALNTCIHGWDGIVHGCLGILVGFLLLMPFYVIGGMTAGDVKWLSALGAWYGPKGILGVFLVSGMILGVISILWFVSNRNRPSPVEPSDCEASGVDHQTGIDEVFNSSEKRRRLIPYALPVALGVLIIESMRLIASLA